MLASAEPLVAAITYTITARQKISFIGFWDRMGYVLNFGFDQSLVKYKCFRRICRDFGPKSYQIEIHLLIRCELYIKSFALPMFGKQCYLVCVGQ